MQLSDAERIFNEALHVPEGDQRTGFIQGACGADAALQEKVLRLLDAHENAPEFLATEPGDRNDFAEVTEEPGNIIGRFKLLQRIGEGGFGVVYMAEQTQPVVRRVALKIIKLGMDTKQVIARFEAERQALAMMDHPHIAKVLDAGTTQSGRPYFAMELVHGVPITRFCDDNDLPIDERLNLFMGVCSAIQHAHQKGVIHRDIKPSNVMITMHDDKPVPKVIDFGIAKAIQQRLTEKTLFTNYAQFVGTPAYVSPEQAQMSGLDIDTRSDIYSLGVLLYELLTGRTPLNGRDLVNSGIDEIRRRIREEDPPKPSTRISTLVGEELTTVAQHRRTDPKHLRGFFRGDLDWIVMKALEKDRTRRYDTAKGFANDVRRYLNDEPVEAAAPSLGYRSKKFLWRHRKAVATVALVSTALVVGTAVSVWQAVRATRASERERIAHEGALEALGLATAERERANQEARSARQHQYASDLLLARQAIELSDLRRARELLDQHDPSRNDALTTDLRGWEWHWLRSRLRLGDGEQLARLPGSAFGLSLSHDGRYLAATTLAGHLFVLDAETGRELATIEAGDGMPMKAEFFVDDHRLIYNFCDRSSFQSQGFLNIWDMSSMREERSFEFTFCTGPKRVNTSVTRALFYSPLDQNLRLLDLNTGRIAWAMELPTGNMHTSDSFQFAGRDEERFIIGTATGEIRIHDVAIGEEIRKVKAHPGFVTALAVAPDQTHFASSGGFSETTIQLWNYPELNSRGRLEGHLGWVSDVEFSSDGERLVSSSADQTVRMWDLGSKRELGVFRGIPEEVWEVEWTPDNQFIIAGGKDGSIFRWEAREQQPAHSPLVTTNIGRFALSDDGSHMVVQTRTNTLRMASIGDEIRIANREFGGDDNSFVNLSKDGRHVLAGKQDGSIAVYDANTTRQLHSVRAFGSMVMGAEFLGDTNTILASDKDHHVALIHVNEPENPVVWDSTIDEIGPIRSFNVLAVSPDKRIAVQKNWYGKFVLLHLENGREILSAQNPSSQADILDQAFSLDGRLLATADGSGVVGLWDVATMERVATLEGHRDSAAALVFLPGGERLASGGAEDNAVIVWDLNSRRELLRLQAPGRVVHLRFSEKHQTLIGLTDAGGLYAWRAPME